MAVRSSFQACLTSSSSTIASTAFREAAPAATPLPPSWPSSTSTGCRGGTHTSNYGWYISSIYAYNGHVFNIPSADWGLEGYYGGFGYFLQDAGGSSLQHSIRLKEYITYHGLSP